MENKEQEKIYNIALAKKFYSVYRAAQLADLFCLISLCVAYFQF